MSSTVNVKTAEYYVTDKEEIIETGSIGSCVAIVIFDPAAHIGGMAHAMLPERHTRSQASVGKTAKFVDESIDLLLEGIRELGGDVKHLNAKIVGGAKMFKHLSGDNKGIGFQNIEAAKKYLKAKHVALTGEDTGGSHGRLAEFNVHAGILKVDSKI
ncbi:MAG: chemotaxis protein CheD [Candidatus Magasanikbacteria bacterium]|jgi:chemotaxis protein CheD|nr:chemotaxis protein CheD [Candidatus Magasanikbacteria bacterium]